MIDESNAAHGLLSVFSDSAGDDALKYLSLADGHDKTSVLTQFNRVRLDVLSRDTQRIKFALEQFKAIQVPNDNCHAADISWHQNNYEDYVDPRTKLRTLIETEDGNSADLIEGLLKRNADEATKIEKKRGEMWTRETPRNRAIVNALLVGTAIAGTLFLSEDARSVLIEILIGTGNLLESALGDGTNAMLGDGGIATQMARVTFGIFGDGGIA